MTEYKMRYLSSNLNSNNSLKVDFQFPLFRTVSFFRMYGLPKSRYSHYSENRLDSHSVTSDIYLSNIYPLCRYTYCGKKFLSRLITCIYYNTMITFKLKFGNNTAYKY
uniref:Uncharacterized protein n=1 Tax=Schizaphis graminum TaxID=13262 RepID=A0A2S2PU25_SCHGA